MIIENLAVKIDGVAKTLDTLVLVTKKGFDENTQEHRKIGNELKELKNGQDQIKLRLDNVSYRFELIALSKRVEFLEKKHGISHR